MKNFTKDIVKSFIIINVVQIALLLVGIIKNKILAEVTGTDGFGIYGALISINGLAGTIFGLGIGYAAIREIAAKNDSDKEYSSISNLFASYKIGTFILGVIGSILILLFSERISVLTFNTIKYSTDVKIISFSVLFMMLTGTNTALLQGLRKVRDYGLLTLVSGIISAICFITLTYFMGLRGFSYSILVASILTYSYSLLKIKRIKFPKANLNTQEFLKNIKILLSVGIVFFISYLFSNLSAYIVKIAIISSFDLQGNGIYQAAISLTSLFFGAILSTIGIDYYPRLTSLVNNSEDYHKLINQQMSITLLLIYPALILFIVILPYVIPIFFNHKFTEAFIIALWILIGIPLKHIGTILSTTLIATDRRIKYLISDITQYIFLIIFIYPFVKSYELEGVGISIFLSNLIYFLFALFLIDKQSMKLIKWKNYLMLIKVMLILIALYLLSALQNHTLFLIFGLLIFILSILDINTESKKIFNKSLLGIFKEKFYIYQKRNPNNE